MWIAYFSSWQDWMRRRIWAITMLRGYGASMSLRSMIEIRPAVCIRPMSMTDCRVFTAPTMSPRCSDQAYRRAIVVGAVQSRCHRYLFEVHWD
jgi:hypothetical protein